MIVLDDAANFLGLWGVAKNVPMSLPVGDFEHHEGSFGRLVGKAAEVLVEVVGVLQPLGDLGKQRTGQLVEALRRLQFLDFPISSKLHIQTKPPWLSPKHFNRG